MHAYFDDAKSFGRANVVLLAGYLADDHEWEALSREWRALLRKHQMGRLHTSDFLSGKSAEYQEHHGDCTYEERIAIVREFMEPIRKHILCGFVIAVDAPAYREVFKDRQKKPSPEEFCFIRLVRRVMDEMGQWTDPFPLHLVFDGSDHSMRFYSIYQSRKAKDEGFRKGVAGVTFADNRLVMPVQAADLLACVTSRETHKEMGTWMEDSPFADIMNAMDPVYGKLYRTEFWNAEELAPHKEAFTAATWKGEL